jgi:hypothetical protein
MMPAQPKYLSKIAPKKVGAKNRNTWGFRSETAVSIIQCEDRGNVFHMENVIPSLFYFLPSK